MAEQQTDIDGMNSAETLKPKKSETANQKSRSSIYPNLLPSASYDNQAQPSRSIGINKVATQPWDGKSGHFIDFSNKDETYGKPPEGSLTEQRAQRASRHINNEVLTLVSVIRGIGERDETNPDIVRVSFGKLFSYYTTISNKVAGILLRARRWNLVEFTGEMLYQGQDNSKIITLLVGTDVIPTIREYSFLEQKTQQPLTLKEKLRKLNSGLE